jgi:hypothetical protein
MCERHLRVENGDKRGFANGDLISLDDDPISPSISTAEADVKSNASPGISQSSDLPDPIASDYMDAASSSQLWPGAIVS